jgi:hypothetical protein
MSCITNKKNSSDSDDEDNKKSKIDREKTTSIFIVKFLVIQYLN